MNEEEKYLKELEDAGVEIDDAPKVPEVDEPKEESEVVEKVISRDPDGDEDEDFEDDEEDSEEEDDSIKEKSTKSKKRSIYDDLKSRKKDLKSEKQLRESIETERDDLKQRIEALESSSTVAEKTDAIDELNEYADKYDIDIESLEDLQKIFIKNNPGTDSETSKQLAEFQDWKSENSKAISESSFNKEFKENVSSVKKMFPNVTDSELSEIKKATDKLAHTEDWADKDLDYIIFKNQGSLGKLISPKKRGMESNEKNEEGIEIKSEFNPEADFSKMSPKQRENWEKQYNKLSQSDGLTKNSDGRMIIT